MIVATNCSRLRFICFKMTRQRSMVQLLRNHRVLLELNDSEDKTAELHRKIVITYNHL